MSDVTLLTCATEFIVKWKGETIYISRYDNHRRLRPYWSVCSWKNTPYGDSTNPWYLGADGVWRYKNGLSFDTAETAFSFLEGSACAPGTNGWLQRTEHAHEMAKSA